MKLSSIFLRVKLLLLFLLSLSGNTSVAQTEIQLLTCYPGEEFFQLEGHTGLRIIDPKVGDYVVNWGVFDFNTPNFAYRYTKGETDYMAGMTPTDFFLDSYRRENRCVVAQTLNLTPEQKEKLVSLVNENLRPENRVYRYNYVKDNCATRPLAMVETAVGDTLRLGQPCYDGHTFREAMRHYHDKYPWYQFGIDLALGSGIDQPISRRQMAFSPVDLESLMQGAQLPSGEPVVEKRTILTGDPSYDATLGPTPWFAAPLFICFCFLFITLLIDYVSLKRRKVNRIWTSVMYGLFGLAGCVITFLVFVSTHEATSPNYLILWLNPLCLFAAVGVWVKRCNKLVYWYQILNFALILALCVILLLSIQVTNPALYFLMAADAASSLTYIWIYRCHNPKISS